MNLLLSKQDREEPICAFYARLKGLASMCNYVVKGKCAHESDVTLNYSDSMIRDVLITSLADEDITSKENRNSVPRNGSTSDKF